MTKLFLFFFLILTFLNNINGQTNLNSFTLNEPSDNIDLTLFTGKKGVMDFIFKNTNPDATHFLIIGNPDTSLLPTYFKHYANDFGKDSTVTIAYQSIINHLSNGKFNINDSFTLKWSIMAKLSNDSIYSVNTFNLRFNYSQPLGKAQLIKENEISIYPNPAKNFIHIEGPEEIANIEIYSIEGKYIFSENVNAKETFRLNIESLNTGNYSLKIELKNGQILNKIIQKQ